MGWSDLKISNELTARIMALRCAFLHLMAKFKTWPNHKTRLPETESPVLMHPNYAIALTLAGLKISGALLLFIK